MTEYIPFSLEQREQARRTDLASFLRHQGETVKPSGSEFQWSHGGEKVTLRANLWYNQYEQSGGDAVDFVRQFYGLSYPEAVKCLLGANCTATFPPEISNSIPFRLPKANGNSRRVDTYLLRQRGIDQEVLDAFMRKNLIYESEKYHNVVFVGMDKAGIPRHAHKRGTGSQSTYKGNAPGSNPEYSFHWVGTDEQLYLFEAPIDLLSFISLHKQGWQAHSYAAACGVSDKVLWQMLHDNPNTQQIYLCFDRDDAGQDAAKGISEKLTNLHIINKILVPEKKDWNEDLLHRKEEFI